MVLHSHMDGGTLVICSVGDQERNAEMVALQEAVDMARSHHADTGERADLLVDMRSSEVNREADELRGVASYFARQLDVLTGRIAIVAERGLIFGQSRMFATFGETAGLTTAVFTSDGTARNWLGRGQRAGASERA